MLKERRGRRGGFQSRNGQKMNDGEAEREGEGPVRGRRWREMKHHSKKDSRDRSNGNEANKRVYKKAIKYMKE